MTNASPGSRATLSMIALACSPALAPTCARAAPDARLLSITAAQAAVIDSPKDTIAIESGSGDLAGLAKMATLLDDRLKALGFKTERRKAADAVGGDIVIGTLTGTGTKKIMLQGHMDTVYEADILKEHRTSLKATSSMARA